MEIFEEGFWEQFKDKKVVLYGAGVASRIFLFWAYKAGIEVAYFVDRDPEKRKTLLLGKEVKAPIELMYEDFDKIKIVITPLLGTDSIMKTLTEMGFSCNKQIVDIPRFVKAIFGIIDMSRIDALLGLSREDKILYNYREKNSDNEMVIVTVGGSTTDPIFWEITSWPFYLQEIIDNNKFAARVVNIAHMGYTSSQELLVLLRDGLSVKPDVVISYSGFNDFIPPNDIENGMRYAYTGRNLYVALKTLLKHYSGEEPLHNIYYGKLESDHFGRHITNMRIMHAMCAEFNCKFYGLLQPSFVSVPVELLHSPFAKAFSSDPYITNLREIWHSFYKNYLENSSAYDYLYDFSHILNEHDDVLIDQCHVTEDGNKIVAENVFNLLVEQKIFEHNRFN